MTMSTSLIESIKRRAADEAERDGYPAGFPVLPPVPAGRYADASFAQLEDDAVFGRSWLMVAHVDELPEPGSYRRVEQLGKPVMLVRGADGQVRAFYNTCKHRGAALVDEVSGTTGHRLTCPYHNWVYSLEGELVGYPDANNFSDLDRDCLALTAIRCETWGPLVFVNLDPEAVSLVEFLGPVAEDLSELGNLEGTLRLITHRERDVPVNWKVPVDANIETYHVNYVHKNTAALGLRQASTGIQLLAGGHSRMLIRLHDGIEMDSPLPALFEGVGDLPRSGTFSYHVFPNLSVVFGNPGFLFFITNWPTGSNTSSYHVHWCASAGPDDPEHGEFLEKFVRLNESVLFEDLTVLPGIQTSIDSGALGSVQLGYQERRIYHVHETIDRVIGPDRIPESLRVAQVLGEHVEV
ncbi:MAG TPA: aromatic ring-hydroxylating dioxygenase subunit alpha [Microthrixaceae bacterium]|nr:aromatic ring-hydroxylating dioxygenase subunit alpha [Microthrixaceae bacterium]